MKVPPSPPGSPEAVLERCLGPDEPLGLALLPLGSGPVPIPGAQRGALALNRNGDVVFLLVTQRLAPDSPSAIADELDRVARLTTDDLTHLGDQPIADLARARRDRFGDVEGGRTNDEQRAVVLVREPLSDGDWRNLVIELGRRLEGVYRIDHEGAISPLEPPLALRRPVSSSGSPRWTAGNWVSLVAVLLGVGIALLGIARVLLFDEQDPVATVDAPLRLVAAGAPSDATHTNWIGQQRAVTTSRGKLVFLYWSGGGLQLVTDQGNRGRSWRSPITVTEAMPTSFSVVADGNDNLHVALLDEAVPTFISLRQSSTGWQASGTLELSEVATTSSVIDLAWDREARVAHVIWLEEDDTGQRLQQATIDPQRDSAEILTESTLVDIGAGEISMLANVAAGPDSLVLATYRRGDEDSGWFSQLGRYDPVGGSVLWQPEETVSADAGVGAASLVMDPSGSAHLLLRNDGGPRLEYFKRSPRGGWSTPEVVAEGETIDEVDLPALSVDVASQLVYAFFQTDRGTRFGRVQAAVRDPAQGWEGPYDVVPESAAPDGSIFPTTLGLTTGEPLIFFTLGGDAPSVQSATLSAP